MEISVQVVENIYVRMMKFEGVGDVMKGHRHHYNHLTLLAYGKLKVSVEGKEKVYKAPAYIFIHKDYEHELTSMAPDTVAYCIHGLRGDDKSDDIIDPESMIIPATHK